MDNYKDTITYKMHKLVYIMDYVADKEFMATTDISFNEFLVFLALQANPQFKQEEIAHWANFNKSTASKTIDKLVVKKYINRTENKIDRRIKDLKITQLGLKEVSKAQEVAESISKRAYQHLTVEEYKTLSKIVNKLEDKITENLIK